MSISREENRPSEVINYYYGWVFFREFGIKQSVTYGDVGKIYGNLGKFKLKSRLTQPNMLLTFQSDVRNQGDFSLNQGFSSLPQRSSWLHHLLTVWITVIIEYIRGLHWMRVT